MIRVMIGTEVEVDKVHADDVYKADVILYTYTFGDACQVVKARGRDMLLEGRTFPNVRDALAAVFK